MRQKMGMVFQGAALFDSMTVFENVAYPLREHTRAGRRRDRGARAREAAVRRPRPRRRDGASCPSELSGGMRKRVGIARGMANNPEIMLYDEPTSGLDPLTTGTITRLIMKLQRELQRHEHRRVARHSGRCSAWRRRVALLHDRRIGSSARRRRWRRAEDAYIRDFLGGLNHETLGDASRGTSSASAGIILAALAVLGRRRSYKLGQAANLFSKRYELVAYLPDGERAAAGRPGDRRRPARRDGQGDRVPAGRQRHDAKPEGVACASIASLREQIRTRLRGAACARMGLLGDKVLDITPGTPRFAVLEPGDTIRVAPSLDYEAVLAQGGRRRRRHGRAHA